MTDDFAPDGQLAKAIPGFKPREPQRQMAVAVTQAIEKGQPLVVEAGTGTGKTYAYLAPALRAKKKVIISTGSKALQDQLYSRDLPTVSKALKYTGNVALLVDEFGGVEGVVTIIDLMAAIVGDMPTASEIADPPIVRREDGSWLVDGQLDTDDLKSLLAVAQLPDATTYQTLGGFLVTRLGRLPRVGDIVDWGDYRFEIVDMDGNRVDKVLIQPV